MQEAGDRMSCLVDAGLERRVEERDGLGLQLVDQRALVGEHGERACPERTVIEERDRRVEPPRRRRTEALHARSIWDRQMVGGVGRSVAAPGPWRLGAGSGRGSVAPRLPRAGVPEPRAGVPEPRGQWRSRVGGAPVAAGRRAGAASSSEPERRGAPGAAAGERPHAWSCQTNTPGSAGRNPAVPGFGRTRRERRPRTARFRAQARFDGRSMSAPAGPSAASRPSDPPMFVWQEPAAGHGRVGVNRGAQRCPPSCRRWLRCASHDATPNVEPHRRLDRPLGADPAAARGRIHPVDGVRRAAPA